MNPDHTIRLAVTTAFESAFAESVPNESLHIRESTFRLQDLKARCVWGSSFLGGFGGIALAGDAADFERFTLLQLSHRTGIAKAAAMSEDSFKAKSNANLTRLVIRIATELASRLGKSGRVRPSRPVQLPVGTEWPQREFDLRHQLILKIGKSTFWGYAGIFTAQPAFTFPPVSTQPPLVAQPVDATVSQSVEADPMPSDEPEAASDPLDSATASAVPTPLDATGFDAEDELTEDGVMARSNADAVDDEMWD